ncbi:MAG: universal stress protein [Gammaproteobacteria bacterium]|nr:universal stress protein [Gammaproteobacteria bacterium]
MRVILVPVADRPESARALKTAFRLGNRFAADIVGCHIRPHRDSSVRMPLLSASVELEWHAAHKGKNTEKLSRNARVLFEQLAAEAGYRVANRPRADRTNVAIWYERVGSPDRVMPIVGPMSDMLVISRPAAKGGRLATIFMMEALLNSCRPVLLLPQRQIREPGRNIVIAWNQSAEASRAIAAGMPMLEAADAVTIAVAGPENEPGPKSSHLRRYLKHRGIQADVVSTRGRDAARELEQVYRQTGADLLLMGAYSRHRLRERIFGGVTDHMLRKSGLPVLIHHV